MLVVFNRVIYENGLLVTPQLIPHTLIWCCKIIINKIIYTTNITFRNISQSISYLVKISPFPNSKILFSIINNRSYLQCYREPERPIEI